MNNQKSQKRAKKTAKAKVEFRIHLTTYMVVNSLLVIINLIFTPGYLWFIWPLMGWGFGIILHGLRVHFSANASLKERMIEKEMENIRRIQIRNKKK